MSVSYEELKKSPPTPEPTKESLASKAERISNNLSKDPIEWTSIRDALGLPGLYSPRDVIWTLYSILKKRYEARELAGKTFIYDPEVLAKESWKDTSEGPLPDIPDHLKPKAPEESSLEVKKPRHPKKEDLTL